MEALPGKGLLSGLPKEKMKNSELIKIMTTANPALQMDDRQLEVCEHLNTFNQLRAYKMDWIEIMEWKDTLMRIKADLNPSQLATAVDGMISGAIPYDATKGIRNVVIALDFVIYDDAQLKWIILKPVL